MSDLVVTYYADDFTGATDVMEVLERSGVATMLFLEPPSPQRVAELDGIAAIGVAGISRTMTRREMDAELAPRLRRIRELRAPLFHYKICSTFDSAPDRGSIGYAAELVRSTFPDQAIPLIVGVPQLGRHTAFGTLFATFDGTVHRLDRHPAMRDHPATPMREADLRRILADQTQLAVDLVDLRELDELENRIAGAEALVLADVADRGHQRTVGRALRAFAASGSGAHPRAVIGSSGVEYALAAATDTQLAFAPRSGTDRRPTLVVVGSGSPASLAQTEEAIAAGFASVPLSPARLIADPAVGDAAADRIIGALGSGENVIVHLSGAGRAPVDGVALGHALARVVHRVATLTRIPRLVVAGGDTSGLVAAQLGIEALRMTRLLAPGAPLCEAIAPGTAVDGLELCLKGGAIGARDFYLRVAAGDHATW